MQLLSKTMEAGKKWNNRLKSLREKCCQTRIAHLVKYPSNIKAKQRHLQKNKDKENSLPVFLEEMLKEPVLGTSPFLQKETKNAEKGHYVGKYKRCSKHIFPMRYL